MPNWLTAHPQFLAPGRYELDHSRPLARGLESALYGSHLPGGGRWVDLSRGQVALRNGAAGWAVSRGGAAASLPGTTADYFAMSSPRLSNIASVDAATGVTMLTRFQVTNLTAFRSICFLGNTVSAQTMFGILVLQTSGKVRYQYRDNAGIELSSGAFDSNGAVSGLTTAAVWRQGTTYKIFLNGIEDKSVTQAGLGTLTTDRQELGRQKQGGNAPNFPHLGQTEYLMIYSRALSTAEIFSLHRNPYQLLRPEPRWWPGVEVAPGGAGIMMGVL